LHGGEVHDDRDPVTEQFSYAACVTEAAGGDGRDATALVLSRVPHHPHARVGHPRVGGLGLLRVVRVLLVVVLLVAAVVDEPQPGAGPSHRTHGRLLSRAVRTVRSSALLSSSYRRP